MFQTCVYLVLDFMPILMIIGFLRFHVPEC